jgi:hypothetical protein
VCVEALVNTGSPSGWRPDYCVGSMLELVKVNMAGRVKYRGGICITLLKLKFPAMCQPARLQTLNLC